jgi:hypothetical protein
VKIAWANISKKSSCGGNLIKVKEDTSFLQKPPRGYNLVPTNNLMTRPSEEAEFIPRRCSVPFSNLDKSNLFDKDVSFASSPK